MPESPAPELDDETTAALTLFNEYVTADRERARRERRVKKAERAKNEAAAAVKRLEEKGAGAEQRAAAETTYREAAEMWRRLRDGEDLGATAGEGSGPGGDGSEPEAADTTADEGAEADAGTEADTTADAAAEAAVSEPAESVTDTAETPPDIAEAPSEPRAESDESGTEGGQED